jgi:hypothetical protein
MAFVIFWVYGLLMPQMVSANELLTRAMAAQSPLETPTKSGRHRVAHQKLQIRAGKQTVIRDFEWSIGSPIRTAHWNSDANPSAWTAPLTAEGFAAWRAAQMMATSVWTSMRSDPG